jgi:putative redox protein
MPTQPLSIPLADGRALSARLDLPSGAPRAYAIFAHCFTCSKESKAAIYISRALGAHGIAVLRFDFAETVFSSNVEDLVLAAAHRRGEGHAPQILVGHSLGGTAVLAAAGRIPEARAVVMIGSPFRASHALHLVPDADRIRADGEAEVPIGGRPVRIRREFIEDLERHDPARIVAALGKALLVLHSPRDSIVAIDNAAQIFMAARHPKSFVSLDDADHLLTRAADAAYAADVIAVWASRYLDRETHDAVAGVRVVEALDGKLAVDVFAGRHRLRVDEPVAVGGGDTGPAPYDLLAAALGACTAMTIRLYAERKQWPLARVRVDLSHDKVHASDCATCETKEGRIDRIERVVTLEGELDGEQRAKLLEIADKCPVHRTLHSEVAITTRLGEA